MVGTLLALEEFSIETNQSIFDDTILSNVSENVRSHVVLKLKMDGGSVYAISTVTEKRLKWPLVRFLSVMGYLLYLETAHNERNREQEIENKNFI